MAVEYLNTWYAGWGWTLWLGLALLLFSRYGNWAYNYYSYKKNSDSALKSEALEILNKRYAQSEISYEQYRQMRTTILDNEMNSIKTT